LSSKKKIWLYFRWSCITWSRLGKKHEEPWTYDG